MDGRNLSSPLSSQGGLVLDPTNAFGTILPQQFIKGWYGCPHACLHERACSGTLRTRTPASHLTTQGPIWRRDQRVLFLGQRAYGHQLGSRGPRRRRLPLLHLSWELLVCISDAAALLTLPQPCAILTSRLPNHRSLSSQRTQGVDVQHVSLYITCCRDSGAEPPNVAVLILFLPLHISDTFIRSSPAPRAPSRSTRTGE